jgi:hypothetical protein
MKEVKFNFSGGPMDGEVRALIVGHVVIGRDPADLPPNAEALVLKNSGGGVSRKHLEIVESDGQIELRNLSGNGTAVNGKLVFDTAVLSPGTRIAVERYEFAVDWREFTSNRPREKDSDNKPQDTGGGLLSSPIVRAVLGLYIAAVLGLGLWFGVFDEDGGAVADDWPWLKESYVAYATDRLSEEEKELRAQRAEELLSKVRILRLQGLYYETEAPCRELMNLDKDIHSPLYQYGAQCVGSIY